MNTSLAHPIRKFNPGTFQSDEEVIRQFVVRRHELAIVLEVLRENIDSPSCQHALLVAPRGRGKTMLLARIAAELRTDQALSSRLFPVRFMEESQEIFNVADFWLETLFHVAREIEATGDYPDLAQELRGTHADLAARWQEKHIAEYIRSAVLQAADRMDRQLVLMVENLQALCDTQVDEDFGWKLRKTLQTEPRIMLLGTATSRFKGLDDVEQPFFELFRFVHLEPLEILDCRRLWQLVSNDEVTKREIRPLQILTGGSPRLLVIVAEFARHRSLLQLMEKLVKLIDDHTEYFRGHLEAITAKNERRVYLAVIDLWQPSTTAEIAMRVRMDIRAVSSLLGRLVYRGVVTTERTGKKRLYSATERLYCIYYKLRRERDEAIIVRNLIHFMKVFYSETEQAEIFAEMSDELRLVATQWPTVREDVTRVIADLPKLGNVLSNGVHSDIELVPDGVRAVVQLKANPYQRLVQFAQELQVSDAVALVSKSLAQSQSGEPEAAIATYDEVVERFGASDVPAIQEEVVKALLNRGVAQGQSGELEAAIVTFDEVVERFGASDVPAVQEEVVKALVNRGVAQSQSGEPEAAIATYDEVVERFGASDVPAIQEEVVKALLNRGVAQGQSGELRGGDCHVTMRWSSASEPAMCRPSRRRLPMHCSTEELCRANPET